MHAHEPMSYPTASTQPAQCEAWVLIALDAKSGRPLVERRGSAWRLPTKWEPGGSVTDYLSRFLSNYAHGPLLRYLVRSATNEPVSLYVVIVRKKRPNQRVTGGPEKLRYMEWDAVFSQPLDALGRLVQEHYLFQTFLKHAP